MCFLTWSLQVMSNKSYQLNVGEYKSTISASKVKWSRSMKSQKMEITKEQVPQQITWVTTCWWRSCDMLKSSRTAVTWILKWECLSESFLRTKRTEPVQPERLQLGREISGRRQTWQPSEKIDSIQPSPGRDRAEEINIITTSLTKIKLISSNSHTHSDKTQYFLSGKKCKIQ